MATCQVSSLPNANEEMNRSGVIFMLLIEPNEAKLDSEVRVVNEREKGVMGLN
jgi:hypothetical protein